MAGYYIIALLMILAWMGWLVWSAVLPKWPVGHPREKTFRRCVSKRSDKERDYG